jgi:hypothetical protein
MSWLLPDLSEMTTRRNKSYFKSVYLGVIGGTFNLPIALWNGVFKPVTIRLWEVLSAYVKFVCLALIGMADVLTPEEIETRRLKAETANALIKAGVKIAEKLADDMDLTKK